MKALEAIHLKGGMHMQKLEKLQAKLRDEGVKLTDQRTELLELLVEAHAPVTAEEIFLLMKAKNPAVCLATVYRNLDLLVSKEVVRQMQLSGNKREYELVGDEHYHYLVCLGCNKTVKLENCPLHHYEAKVCAETEFTIIEHRLSMYGYCPACKPQE